LATAFWCYLKILDILKTFVDSSTYYSCDSSTLYSCDSSTLYSNL